MTDLPLQTLLNRWKSGEIDLTAVESSLRNWFAPTIVTPEVQVDLDRVRRCGYPEVVYAANKTPEAIRDVFLAQGRVGQNSFATRVTADQARIVCEAVPDAIHNPVARTLVRNVSVTDKRGLVTIVSAGTTDRPVAEEAQETARWMGCEADLIVDVGVAGPQRLLAQRDRLQRADSLVVVAGMEGALPSVVAGWVAVPVIAVPTNVGYGASLGGFAALLSMLNSCAANVTVVNIDAGFKAGYVAGMIARNKEGNALRDC